MQTQSGGFSDFSTFTIASCYCVLGERSGVAPLVGGSQMHKKGEQTFFMAS